MVIEKTDAQGRAVLRLAESSLPQSALEGGGAVFELRARGAGTVEGKRFNSLAVLCSVVPAT